MAKYVIELSEGIAKASEEFWKKSTGMDLVPYTEPDQVEVKNNDIHLCESCRYDYPGCPSISQDTLFGDGNDNICCCNKYEPYTEISHKAMKLQHSNNILKVARMNYYKGAEDGWNLAREIAYHMSFKECVDAGMLSDDDIYNDASGVLEKLTYQEAKAKYEEWKKENFRVGDEVIYNSREKAVVLIPETKEKYGTILTENLVTNAVSHVELAKTGRHFDGIEEMIKKMKETE